MTIVSSIDAVAGQKQRPKNDQKIPKKATAAQGKAKKGKRRFLVSLILERAGLVFGGSNFGSIEKILE